MILDASGMGQVKGGKNLDRARPSTFHIPPYYKAGRLGAPGMQSATNQRQNVVAINYFLEYPLFSFGL
jgi:hypothetical protein